ncbi:MAG: peptide-methionine (S)-S-oxide reductase MsrA [Anaerolineaceae bacterium]|jgi:peptide-methionine (S)-S-oxide reductase
MRQTAIVAGGCFWGIESRFQKLAGVVDTEVGYTGGQTEDPTYRQVCQEITGHVEAVKVEFDPTIVTYKEILEAFFKYHDPTLCGDNCMSQTEQYGSIIFPMDIEQAHVAESVLEDLIARNVYDCPIRTIIRPASTFYRAEEYHQNYYKKHNLMDVEEDCYC